jgi:hypothetical protein
LRVRIPPGARERKTLWQGRGQQGGTVEDTKTVSALVTKAAGLPQNGRSRTGLPLRAASAINRAGNRRPADRLMGNGEVPAAEIDPQRLAITLEQALHRPPQPHRGRDVPGVRCADHRDLGCKIPPRIGRLDDLHDAAGAGFRVHADSLRGMTTADPRVGDEVTVRGVIMEIACGSAIIDTGAGTITADLSVLAPALPRTPAVPDHGGNAHHPAQDQ